MFAPLDLLLRRLVRRGHLTFIDAAGAEHRYGVGGSKPITARIADRATERALAFDPQLALGEAYMDGRLTLLSGDIYDLVDLLMANLGMDPLPGWAHTLDVARRRARRLAQYNPILRARRNVRHHYDIDGRIYDLFLDADRQYSCAYVEPDSAAAGDIERAQLAKKRHLAAKLALRPGLKVLDIGCGWGGLGLYLARHAGCHVTGITLSESQLRIARERAWRSGLAKTAHFELEDYRRIDGPFDRVVSVGMFEHVGINHYHAYFKQLRRLLAEDGVAVVHSIGRSDGPGFTNPFIAKYIFPGGYFPALSEVLPAIERSGLIVTDIEILRLHYAETLKAWRQRFMAKRQAAVALQGEAFARMWEFYLAASEAAFRHQGLIVFQVQLARRIDAVPITRDYMRESEIRLAAGDAVQTGETSRSMG